MSSARSQVWSVPGKVFLLGEYAALAGLPALHAAIGPRFELAFDSEGLRFHPESPAGRLIAWAEKVTAPEKVQTFVSRSSFVDPFQRTGGFGASTAQFALTYRALFGEADWSSVWKLYRELTRSEPEFFSPSGADLVTQWQGGVALFDRTSMNVRDLSSSLDLSSLMVFSATQQTGRKVPTHEHLETFRSESLDRIQERWMRALEPALRSGVEAALSADLTKFGSAMNQYGDALKSLDLEAPETSEDRRAIGAISGVLGVKGAGALQSDVILVLVDPAAGSNVLRQVRENAESRGLKPISEGIKKQKGVTEVVR